MSKIISNAKKKNLFSYLFFRQTADEAAIVIPIHKKHLNNYEKISLNQCINVLRNHTIIFIAPEDLQHSIPDIIPSSDKYKVIYFSRKYFKSVKQYSKLLLTLNFYKKFISYKYILVYQLDAFVFSDQLEYWCSLGYDYIGAPWIDACWGKGHNRKLYAIINRIFGRKINMVGNGGFSLRKVKSCILALILLKHVAVRWKQHEDEFWSFAVPGYLPFFTIPTVDMAMRFSFELEPKECFKRINHKLPFGCHAWEKYDIDFWKPFFSEFGYKIYDRVVY